MGLCDLWNRLPDSQLARNRLFIFKVGSVLDLLAQLTMGFYAAIPALRKLMTDCVDESLLGSLYSIPALVEGTGYPLGFIIYSAGFLRHQNQENWIFYGLGSILTTVGTLKGELT
ncbi:unnamed protein product [Oikopleura dioica]|uniref:Uncharacterized protein n=1 Tax=Oikopleura dioica TaxID=34765 RepID=E4XF75_OIKDI|nr:unnamed protein product [Oikopleura dioica]